MRREHLITMASALLSLGFGGQTSAQPPSDLYANHVLVDAGLCRIYTHPRLADQSKYLWRGECKNGLADGPGLLETSNPVQRSIGIIQGPRKGGYPAGPFVAYYRRDGLFERATGDGLSDPKAEAISASQLPDWAAALAR